MSAPTPPAVPAPVAPPRVRKEPNEITIFSHSNLFYWWPVWLCGFIVAMVTWAQGGVMAVVPKDSKAVSDAIAHKNAIDYTDIEQPVTIVFPTRDSEGNVIKKADGTPATDSKTYDKGTVHILVTPLGETKSYAMPSTNGKTPDQPHLYVLPHRIGGVIFVFILLMVIFITNVPLRGMWSLLVIVLAVALVVIFITVGWIESIITWLALLDVRINMAGYMTIAVFLFIIWLVALLAFDRQRYIIFTPGQFKVCDEIGGGEQVYSTDGISFQKQRSDFFRHYVLGLGSGDLIVRTAGAQSHHIDFPNVLFIQSKVQKIEQLIAQVGDRVEVTSDAMGRWEHPGGGVFPGPANGDRGGKR